MLNLETKIKNKGILIVSIFGALFFSIIGTGIAYGYSFKDSVLPGVHIGSFDIGGMGESELEKFVEDMHLKLLSQGIPVTFDVATSSGEFVLSPQSISDEAVIEFITVDSRAVAQKLVSYQKSGNIFVDSIHALTSLIAQPSIAISDISYQKEKIFAEIDHNMSSYITPPVDAGLTIRSISPLKYNITPSSRGISFEYEDIFDEITNKWSKLEQPTVHITTRETGPVIVESDIENITSILPDAFSPGALTLIYTNSSTQRDYSWKITPTMISRWIGVNKDANGHVAIILSPSSTYAYLHDTVASIIDVPPQDAKFKVGTDSKVAEFEGSHPGVTVDLEQTYHTLATLFESRFTSSTATSSQTIALLTKEVQPKIKTGDVNDLGIAEVLGVGHSVFKGSPGNRFKNIKLAAFKKLDGTLIKPGENFSLLNNLKPFTLEAGYLAELAIKGDRLEPEIGGGLCQIGTTMFRAAMNAGLEITERRNHSLMVSYYNDLRNNNPGTDATIYDPGTDFRFLNDTGHYILITSEMNDKTGDLYFTLWGTSDGRKGYYLPPTVSRRIPAGPTRTVETTDLPPGKKECQHAFPGAVASFTYIREMPNGEKKEEVFTSSYRPLPEICLVGVEKKIDSMSPPVQESEIEETVSQNGVLPPEDVIGEFTFPNEG